MVWRFIRFGVKAGLSIALVEYTIEQGVWGSSEESTKLYGEAYSAVAPYLKDVPVEVPEFPKLSNLGYNTRYYWNTGVKKTVNFIQNIPTYSVEYSTKGWEMIQQFAEPPKPADQ